MGFCPLARAKKFGSTGLTAIAARLGVHRSPRR
jgi:hypothetical protein